MYIGYNLDGACDPISHYALLLSIFCVHYLQASKFQCACNNLLKQVMYNSVFVEHFILSLFGDEFYFFRKKTLNPSWGKGYRICGF